MRTHTRRAVLLVLVLVLANGLRADTKPTSESMVARIDQLLTSAWDGEDIEPAEPCDDSTFIRRAYLDLTGVIPPVSAVRRFLDDQSPEKRSRLIDQLIHSPGYTRHQSNRWRHLLVPDAASVPSQDLVALDEWLHRQFLDNLRFDRVVADLLLAGRSAPGPAVFFTAQQVQPEKLAAETASTFLGLQIECAQCHDHPYDDWTQRDFWGLAAFFARLAQQPRSNQNSPSALRDLDAGEVTLPDSTEVIEPRFPGSELSPDDFPGNRREKLASWIAARDNPYFARSIVNRAWAQLFGRGIVDPVDDLSSANPPSQPQLLDELTQFFVRTGFDLRELYRVLANSQAYQMPTRDGEVPISPGSFARMAIKPLSPEALYDSLSRIVIRPELSEDGRRMTESPLLDTNRQAFLEGMTASGRSKTDYHAGILQALSLLNGVETATASSPDADGLLTAVGAPLFTDEQRIETLFLASLARRPTTPEMDTCLGVLAQAESSQDRQAALSDILWALINCAEFALNH